MVRSIKLITATAAIATVLAAAGIVHAEKGNSNGDGNAKQIAELPAIIVWGKAKRNAYPHTEASDAAVAAARADYTPELPSASLDENYWQLSKITLADPSKAEALKSEEENLATEAARFATTDKIRISGNCPTIS